MPTLPIVPATTFSILARDAENGALGVAVQSRYFDVGSVVPWAEAGVGAVATQAFLEPGYGPRALAMLRKGANADEALTALLAEDAQREIRQVAVLDDAGRAAAHTGALAVPFAEHKSGDGWSVQGNMLATGEVCAAMERAFHASRGELAERLLQSLEAGQREGGDLRGMQAAALLVVQPISAEEPWRNRVVDLRVEDAPDPIQELRRLYRLRLAKRALDTAEQALLRGRIDDARAAFEQGLALSDRHDEFLFWGGLALGRVGDDERAVALLDEAIAKNAAWRTMLERLPALLKPSLSLLAKLAR